LIFDNQYRFLQGQASFRFRKHANLARGFSDQ
jgi:hypothetical protein